jgi:hypothetical protein
MEWILNPDVIKAASTSQLGILSLMILVLALITLVFFHRAPVWLRFLVFVFLFAGVSGYGYSLQSEGQKFRDSKIQACVATRIDEFQVVKVNYTDGGARAPGPGLGGGRKTATEDLCYSVGPSQEIVSAKTTNLTCHGGRCSVTAPKISGDNKRVCVTTTAWSDSKSFGGGGSGQYRLEVRFRDIASEEQIRNFNVLCASETTNPVS